MRNTDIWDDINPFQSNYIGLANFIKEKSGGRQIVFHGDAPLMEKLLYDKYDIAVRFISTVIKEKTNISERHRLLDEFKGKSDEYFIVITFLDYSEQLKFKFQQMGYEEFEDFVFFNHKPIVFPKGKRISYNDNYGINIVSNGSMPIFINKSAWNVDINIQESVRAGANSKVLIEGSNNHLRIDEKCVFSGNNVFIIRNNSAIEIQGKCTFWDNCAFHAENGAKISIGFDCMFSKDITCFAGDGHAILDVNSGKGINAVWPLNDRSNIILGNHVWVGLRNTLLACSIGDSSIVGAASLVKGKFPNNCIIAGMPAKIIRTDITWSRNGYCNSLEQCSPEYVKNTNMEEFN